MLEIKNIASNYGKETVLNNITHSFDEGKVVGILGKMLKNIK